MLTRFISSSLPLTLSASLAPQPRCCWECPNRILAEPICPKHPGATLSEELHTPPLPVTRVFLGYCWSYSRFTTLAVKLTRSNNDTPSFRSYQFANPLPMTAQEIAYITPPSRRR
jgi:hypothetical protein